MRYAVLGRAGVSRRARGPLPVLSVKDTPMQSTLHILRINASTRPVALWGRHPRCFRLFYRARRADSRGSIPLRTKYFHADLRR